MQNSSFCRDTAAVPETLRILTYNVRNGQGLDAPEIMDVARIGRVIAAQQPDVVALQELDRKTRRSAERDILRELAEATGMRGSITPASACLLSMRGLRTPWPGTSMTPTARPSPIRTAPTGSGCFRAGRRCARSSAPCPVRKRRARCWSASSEPLCSSAPTCR